VDAYSRACVSSLTSPSAPRPRAPVYIPDDLPPHFYELTKEDMTAILRQQRACKRQEQKEQEGFRTKYVRLVSEAERAEKLHTNTTIRITFTDHHLLQGEFHPKESLADLYAFVEQSLTPAAREHFYLCRCLGRVALATVVVVGDINRGVGVGCTIFSSSCACRCTCCVLIISLTPTSYRTHIHNIHNHTYAHPLPRNTHTHTHAFSNTR
jgi:hypothetical protein